MVRKLVVILLCYAVPALADVLTLEQAVERSLAVSRRIAEAKVDVQLQNMEVFKAVSTMSPLVKAKWTDTQFERPIVIPAGKLGPDPFVIQPLTQTLGSITIIQPITTLLVSIAGMRAQLLRRQASQKTFEQTQVDVAFASARAYRELQKLFGVYALMQRRVISLNAAQKMADANYQLGSLKRSDWLAIQVRTNQAQIALSSTKAGLEIAMSMFRDMLDAKDGENFELEELSSAQDLNPHVDIPELGESNKTAMRHNRMIEAARLGKRALGEGALFSWFDWLPNAGAFVSWTKQFGQISPLMASEMGSAGLLLEWTMWDGGARFITTRTLQLQAFKLKLKVTDAERLVSLELQKSQSDLTSALEVFGLQKTSREQADSAFQDVNERWRLGAISISEFLLAEDTHHAADLDLMTAVADLDVKYMAWKKSMGESRPVSMLNEVSQ